MTRNTQPDSIYYRDAGSMTLARRVSLIARTRVYKAFIGQFQPGPSTTIVDIGASDHGSEEANVLEAMYPYPQNITCATTGDGAYIMASYPQVKWQPIEPGKPLPFEDDSFDIAYSNAVLEHVGGPEQRRRFIAESLRVARSVFVVVPNRWFPIEHHTGLPLLHYSPDLFRRVLSGTRYDFWTKAENLEFLGSRSLSKEWPGSGAFQVYYSGLPLGPFSSNVILLQKN